MTFPRGVAGGGRWCNGQPSPAVTKGPTRPAAHVVCSVSLNGSSKGTAMKHHGSTPETTRFAIIEPLEYRQLLSATAPLGGGVISVATAGPGDAVTRAAPASSNVGLQGTFTGTVSLNRPVPAIATGHQLSFVMTLSSQNALGQISGSLTLGQLGNFSFSGTVHKHAVQLTFDAGSDSGKLIGSVNGSGEVIHGRLDALVAGHRLDGTVRPTTGMAVETKPHTTRGTGAGAGGTGGTSGTHTQVVGTVSTAGTGSAGTSSGGNTGTTDAVNGGISPMGTFVQPSVNVAAATSAVSFVQPTVFPSIGSASDIGSTLLNAGNHDIISVTVPVDGGVFASTTIA